MSPRRRARCVCGRQPACHQVWDVESTTTAILALADELVGLGIERTVMESTSDYWRPFFYLLEASGLGVAGDARAVKQAPGRPKTDKLDAVAAKLNERGCCACASCRRRRSAAA